MTPVGGREGTSRRAAMAKARQSRRPSRLGTPAGLAAKPDHVTEENAGFAGLLRRTWRQALDAPSLAVAARALLTLGGHVPADVQLRALRATDECALRVLCGLTWRQPETDEDRTADEAARDAAAGAGESQPPTAFHGELGLTVGGRIVLRAPSQPPLNSQHQLVDGVLRTPWPVEAVRRYQREVARAAQRSALEVADCRQWLAAAGQFRRNELVERLREAALRTAPFVLYQQDRQYTNFRDRNTVTGKTLWPGHPDCALSALTDLPLQLWSDNDVALVVCLTLLVRSGGFARIEEANGTQLTLGHVAHLLERTRHSYNRVPAGRQTPPTRSHRVSDLNELAVTLRAQRKTIGREVQLYREIHGALMHKIERIAGPRAQGSARREAALCAHLGERLPVAGDTLAQLGAAVAASPDWLARPHGEFATGLESLVCETVAGAARAFAADFAMSRGLRSLPRLIRAMREQDWDEITRWEIADFFCCVAAAPEARRHFDDSPARLADMAWAMSARMQYNSWHFIAGNLPRVPAVVARDHFVPPVIPDVAYFSDQHHHGHVAARVRFSIRSPQQVTVLGQPFDGFIDLRLLRCDGSAFDEQDLLAAHSASAFVARATSLAASLVADGADIEVTSFDSQWHWNTISAAAR